MDTGRFDGIIAASLLRPKLGRVFNHTSYRNGSRCVIGTDIFSVLLGAAAGVAHEADGSDWVDFTTAATTNAQGGTETTFLSNGYLGRPDVRPSYGCRVKFSSAANVRFWAGMAEFGSGTFMGSDDPGDDVALFRFSTSAGDTNIMCLRNDGSGACTVVDSGIPFAIDTEYELMIRFVTATTIEWWINGVRVLVATSGNIPGATVNLCHVCGLRTLADAAKTMKIKHQWNAINV
jgi:hypothetical protein